MEAKERLGGLSGSAARDNRLEYGARAGRPLLMVDIDGVISLFCCAPRTGGSRAPRAGGGAAGLGGGHGAGSLPEGCSMYFIEGIPHLLSSTAAAHLLELGELFELVWASGWEERADEHLPHLLGLPAGLPHLRFERSVGRSHAHWKLDAIERHAGTRALAWVDDCFDEHCLRWAARRPAPTLLVPTDPARGLTELEAGRLLSWARALGPQPS